MILTLLLLRLQNLTCQVRAPRTSALLHSHARTRTNTRTHARRPFRNAVVFGAGAILCGAWGWFHSRYAALLEAVGDMFHFRDKPPRQALLITANHFCFITLGQTLTYRPMHDVRASYVTESLSSVNIWQNPACRR